MSEQPLKQRIVLYTDFQRMQQDFDRVRKGYINIGSLIQCDMTNRVITYDPNVNTIEKWEIAPSLRQPPKTIRFVYLPVSASFEYLAGMMADEVDDSRVLPVIDQMRERVVAEVALLKSRMQNQRAAIEKRNSK